MDFARCLSNSTPNISYQAETISCTQRSPESMLKQESQHHPASQRETILCLHNWPVDKQNCTKLHAYHYAVHNQGHSSRPLISVVPETPVFQRRLAQRCLLTKGLSASVTPNALVRSSVSAIRFSKAQSGLSKLSLEGRFWRVCNGSPHHKWC